MRHNFPLTVIDLGLRSTECEYRLSPPYRHQAIVGRLLEVEAKVRSVGRVEIFDGFLNELVAMTCSDERMTSASRDVGLILRTDEGAD